MTLPARHPRDRDFTFPLSPGTNLVIPLPILNQRPAAGDTANLLGDVSVRGR